MRKRAFQFSILSFFFLSLFFSSSSPSLFENLPSLFTPFSPPPHSSLPLSSFPLSLFNICKCMHFPNSPSSPLSLSHSSLSLLVERMKREMKMFIYSPPSLSLPEYIPSFNGAYEVEKIIFEKLKERREIRCMKDCTDFYIFIPLVSAAKLRGRMNLSSTFMAPAFYTNFSLSKTREKYPYFDMLDGRRHAWTSVYDGGKDFGVFSDERLCANSSVFVANADINDYHLPNKKCLFDARRDVSVPCSAHQKRSLAAFQKKDLAKEKRKGFAFFAGRIHNSCRRKMVKSFSTRLPFMGFRLSDSGNPVDVFILSRMEEDSYREYLSNTTFCLCPRGSRVFSPRLFEAIWYGCIPVVIADCYQLPFSCFLDWTQFSVIIAEDNAINTHEILRSISKENIQKMRENLDQVRSYFSYFTPPSYSSFFTSLFSSLPSSSFSSSSSSQSSLSSLSLPFSEKYSFNGFEMVLLEYWLKQSVCPVVLGGERGERDSGDKVKMKEEKREGEGEEGEGEEGEKERDKKKKEERMRGGWRGGGEEGEEREIVRRTMCLSKETKAQKKKMEEDNQTEEEKRKEKEGKLQKVKEEREEKEKGKEKERSAKERLKRKRERKEKIKVILKVQETLRKADKNVREEQRDLLSAEREKGKREEELWQEEAKKREEERAAERKEEEKERAKGEEKEWKMREEEEENEREREREENESAWREKERERERIREQEEGYLREQEKEWREREINQRVIHLPKEFLIPFERRKKEETIEEGREIREEEERRRKEEGKEEGKEEEGETVGKEKKEEKREKRRKEREKLSIEELRKRRQLKKQKEKKERIRKEALKEIYGIDDEEESRFK